MASRRHGSASRARAKALNGKTVLGRERSAGAVPRSSTQSLGSNAAGGAFVPSGYAEAKASVARVAPLDDEGLRTYFLVGDKRGIDVYEPIAQAGKHFREGFRGVFVAGEGLAFDNRSARLVGVVEGDDFEAGLAWAKSNVLDELHADYLRSGGGTAEDRRKCLRAFVHAKAAVERQRRELSTLEDRLHEASVALVRRFGKAPLEIEGQTWDPSYARTRVYWKPRRRA